MPKAKITCFIESIYVKDASTGGTNTEGINIKSITIKSICAGMFILELSMVLILRMFISKIF